MITHLDPDILECEDKRALERITTNKASGYDGIPVELFQMLKAATPIFVCFLLNLAHTQKKEYTEELYKNDLHDPDNHNGVITHLESDILECEWALESIIMNKASGGDGIPVELFQILKNYAVKVLHSLCQQIWKTQQWP